MRTRDDPDPAALAAEVVAAKVLEEEAVDRERADLVAPTVEAGRALQPAALAHRDAAATINRAEDVEAHAADQERGHGSSRNTIRHTSTGYDDPYNSTHFAANLCRAANPSRCWWLKKRRIEK